MAAVYEAEQLSLGKKVAVKVLASELAASTIVIERFFREARAAASVRSPYIVDVYDSGRLDDGRPFITMELLEGESLYDRMARIRIIDVETTIRVIVHTARGLVKAHASGIVHRDLKPENIFLTKGEDGDDVCKILDFGLAKFYAPVNPEEKQAKRLTREGAVFGTPAYMSPEQVKGQGNVDHRADLWALGCMAYECLIGRPVWNMDQGVAMTFASIATGPIPIPSQQRADLPAAFDDWFLKCLERDPNNRYQGAKELADAFVEAWGQRPVSSASYPNVNLSTGTGSHRALGASGSNRVLGTTGSNRVLGGTGANRVLGTTGTNRVLGTTGTNRVVAGDLEAQDLEGDTAALPLPPVSSSRRNVEGAVNGERSGDSNGSVPMLLTRASTDVPTTTSHPDAPVPPPKPSPLRMGLAAAFLFGGISLAFFVYVRFLGPQVWTPTVQSRASAAPVGISSVREPTPPSDEPKWTPAISEGQRLFSVGDIAGAHKKFREAADVGGPPAANIAKVFIEQTKLAERPSGPCKVAAFSRPRLATERKGERPFVAPISKGALVTWIDDHERPSAYHAFGVVIDPTGKSISPIRDLTPDATDAEGPQLAAVGADRLVLLYSDEKGKEAGVRARLLDGDGRIDQLKGQVVRVGGTKPGQFWPAIDKDPEGFWVVWQDDRDKDGDHDLFARRLSNELDTKTAETRLTDYVVAPRSKGPPPRVKYPSVAVSANTLLITYKLENDREKSHSILRLRVPLDEAQKKGLEESKNAREDRFLGSPPVMVSEEKVPADAPSIACGGDGCFVAWQVEAGGAMIAKIDPIANNVLWRKKLSDKGGHPSLGVNNGVVAVSWYEKQLIKFSVVNDSGPVLPPSSVFRIHEMSYPRPAISAGANKNEWYMTWQDSDQPKGQPEIYASRITCR
jgi:serine/threonine-protein kinase